MFERILNSKNFVSATLAFITGLILYILYPFPATNLYLQLISIKDPTVYAGIFWTYSLMMFTTPFILYSAILSGIYIFGYKHGKGRKPVPLPPYPNPAERQSLFLILGEQHHQTKFASSLNPTWLQTPERGLYTGKIYVGAVGSGKTTCGMRPDADQLIGFKCSDKSQRIGGLVLEVKGDFCPQVKDILAKYGRGEDYIEIALDSDYRYNPLHNDLDAYALAYGIASLLSNLFGKGKEPFWQQAYTNLVKFIILLHKVVYDYVTFFDIYECTISPAILEKKIQEGEKLFRGKEYLFISAADYRRLRGEAEKTVGSFTLEAQNERHRAECTRDVEDTINGLTPPIPYNTVCEPSPTMDRTKWEQLEAIKRWFHNDWMKIDTKLRTSIVEGISVFLSLFDDNPQVKQVFCPPKETYDTNLNTTVDANDHYKYGKPLPSFSWLIEEGK